MALNDLQKAFIKNILVPSTNIIDPDTGEAIDFDEIGGASAAADVTFTPTGTIAATNVQAAIAELDSEKQALDADLTALAAITAANLTRRSITVQFGDGSAVIAAGAIAAVARIPFAWTDIVDWTIISEDNTSGSIVVDVQKATYANAPGSYSSIAASAKPTLSSATKNENTTLTGWTKTGAAGDSLKFITEATPASVKVVSVSLTLVL